MFGQMNCNFAYRNIRCTVGRKAIRAGADRGESNRLNLMCDGQLQTIAITGGKQVVFIVFPIAPDRADGVNDMLCRKLMAGGDSGITRVATAKLSAFFEKSFTSRAMYRSIDAASAQERGIGSIDDRIHLQPGNVGIEDFDLLGPGHEGQCKGTNKKTHLSSGEAQVRHIIKPGNGYFSMALPRPVLTHFHPRIHIMPTRLRVS